MRLTRRSYLASLGGVTLGAMAGCLGGSDSGALLEGCDVGTLDTVSSLDRPALGSADAPVTVGVFEDFTCPHCRTFTESVSPKIESNYVDPGDVQFRFFDFPIPVSDWSWFAASAARAVQDRSDDETFFAFTKRVYENQDQLSERGYQLVHDHAAELDVDGCEVAAAAEQEAYRPVVEADRQLGRDRGVSGTPTVFVDGQPLEGYDWQTVRDAIERSLEGSN